MKFKKITATVLALALMFTMSSTFSVLAVTSADIEIRGTIIKTFDNADFPSKPNLSENEIKQEADNIIKNASNLGLNAIFIDVKPLSEVFYRSEIYPSSYFLTGGQYRNLTFDLLEYIISKGKENGISIYAYISSGKATKIVPETQINQIMLAPFRDPLIDYSSAEIKALSGSYDWQNVLNVTNPAFLHPDWLVQNGSYSYFDIGIPEVRSLIANTAKELSKYDISGILLGSDFYPAENFDDSKSLKQYGKGKDIDTFRKDNIISLVQEVSKALPDNIMLGISPADVFDDKTTSKYFDTSSVINLIDFIMPKIEFNANNEDLTAQYEHWNDITKDTNVKLIHATTLDAVYYEGEDSDKFAVNYQIAMARNNNSSGHIFTDYSGLLSNPANMKSALATIYGDRYVIRDNLNLPISKTLDITRPAENVYLSDSKYFIMGTSDPTLPLYINGVEITNRSENGTFGYMLTLSGNKTTVTAKQGGKSVTRTITKPSGTSTISAITQSSMFPSVDDYYLSGETIKLSCIAPSGGSVSANINGQTIYLKQAAATSKNGVAATYTANYTVPSLANELKNYGKITYTLTYGGKTTTYQSTGKLYMGGASSKPVLKVITDIGNVFSEPNSNSDVEALRLNATVYSEGKSGSFFKLKMGGYIPKSHVDILEGSPNITNTVSVFSWKTDEKSNTLVLSGTSKAGYSAVKTSSSLKVTFYDTTSLPSITTEGSTMCSSVTVSQNGDNATLTFNLNEGETLYGYNVEYDKNNINIYLRKKPVLTGNAEKPLEGIKIVLDPGHGGTDPGALGPAGSKGPTESQMTLAAVYAAKAELEKMGAKVYLTRTNEIKTDFPERMNLAQIIKADLFISVHYNSVATSTDSSKSWGTESYYYTTSSKKLANNLINYVSSYNDRKLRKAIQSTYRVTRLHFADSCLLELGFLPNPIEYDEMTQKSTLTKTGKAIADAVLDTLK